MRDEGFAGLYRGLGATLIQVRVRLRDSVAVAHQQRKARCPPVDCPLHPCKPAASQRATWLCWRPGNAGRICLLPLRSALHGLRSLRCPEPVRPTFPTHSLGTPLLQVAPSLAINYCAYETLRSHWLSHLPDRHSPTVAMSLLCGSFAGLISSTATFPLDLARRRMQVRKWRNPVRMTKPRKPRAFLQHRKAIATRGDVCKPHLPAPAF